MTILLEGLLFHKHFYCLPGSDISLSLVDNNQDGGVSIIFLHSFYVWVLTTYFRFRESTIFYQVRTVQVD